ncbi:MAG TPA: hypothetical protein VKB47_02150 [Terracidiphilus sp.]|nr:hypothetical protein [Terracidiphilus sp.]
MQLSSRRRLGSPHPSLLGRISFNSALQAAIAFTGMAISGVGFGGQVPPHSRGPSVSSDSRDTESRELHGRPSGLNLNAFNQERTNAIAKDSEKLLALTEALKSELDRDPNKAQSDDVIRKVKEIEKLAHKVKERMLADPTPSPLLR